MLDVEKHELKALLTKLCDDQISEAEQNRLAEILADEEAQVFYMQWMELHVDLMAHGQSLYTEELLSTTEPGRDRSSINIHTIAWTLLSLAAVFLFALFSLSAFDRTKPVEMGVAKIVVEEDLVWDSDAPIKADVVSTGTLSLRSGSAELLMNCGARMLMEGPAAIEILDAKAIKLVSGKVSLDVPDSGVGFRVLTASADVVDLGTTFSVSVDDSGSTQVHVDAGVVVARSQQDDGIVPLLAREAAHFDSQTGDFASITFEAGGFAKRIEPAHQEEAFLRKTKPVVPGSRIVFLGDRATDKETHLLMMAQAFESVAEVDRLKFFNAGICFSLFDETDFDTIIVPLKPTHAVLEFGSEIATYPSDIPASQFARRVEHLCGRLEKAGIVPILETTILSNDSLPKWRDRLADYNEFLRRLARQRDYRLIDFAAYQAAHSTVAEAWIAPYGIALTVDGYRHLAKLVLSGISDETLSLPESIVPKVIDGTITEWKYRFHADRSFLTEAEVQGLAIDDTWQDLHLPQAPDKILERATGSSYLVTPRDRQRGFATGLWGKDKSRVIAVSTVHSETARSAYLNTGATLRSVWLNGERIYGRYAKKEWTGWHAGKERIPIELQAGDNQIVIEADNSFYVGITESPDWSIQ